MSDKMGEFMPVFGWVIHSQRLEMIGGRLVWIIFLLAKLNLSLADKWGQTWISMDRDAGFLFLFFPFLQDAARLSVIGEKTCASERPKLFPLSSASEH